MMSQFWWQWIGNAGRMHHKSVLGRFLALLVAGMIFFAGSILYLQNESTLGRISEPYHLYSSSGDNLFRVNESLEYERIEADRWTYSQTRAIKQRKRMRQYFDWWSLISLTKNQTKIGEKMHFHYSRYKYVYPIGEALHSLLPEKRPTAKRLYDTCAIVGNGGILLDSNCGKDIDSSDFIFRCNSAPIHPYKQDVGEKTDFMTFNPSVIGKHFGNLSTPVDVNHFSQKLLDLKNVTLWVPAFFHHKISLLRTVDMMVKFFKENPDVTKNIQLAVPGNVFTRVIKFWKTEGIFENRLSTGLLMYSIAAGMCQKITLYGFYPFDSYFGKFVPYHYEDNRTDFDFGYKRFHDLPKEYEYLRKLHREGALKLKVGKCTS